MIVVTGAAGFIGSCLVQKLNEENFNDLILVDDFTIKTKSPNLEGKKFTAKVHRDDFAEWLDKNHKLTQFIFHLGARTDTTEFNKDVFDKLNLNYSKTIWLKCIEYGLPLVYASSAATYGAGGNGYDDDEMQLNKLKPLNPYGDSKNEFDKWAIANDKKPYFFAGLKFFNVYGPNEYHKSRMASVVFHGFNQALQTGKIKLFKSHKAEFKDGWQLRDFIYVKDVVNVCYFFLHHRKNAGIYNLGTGKARSFYDLAVSTFNALNKNQDIEFIDMPVDIRDKYQYFTEANMQKLLSIGYPYPFYTLEEGVTDYVKNYLLPQKFY